MWEDGSFQVPLQQPSMVPSYSHGSYANLPLLQSETPAHPSSCSSVVQDHAGTELMGSHTVGLCSALGFEPGITLHQGGAGRMHLHFQPIKNMGVQT